MKKITNQIDRYLKGMYMKIAIFYDFIDAIGGGEKLMLTLAREFGADVITTDLNMESVKKMGFEDVKIISIGKTIKIPVLKHISTSLMFKLNDFSKEYDFFIFMGYWSYFAAKKHKPNIWYCFTPTRAFYDLYDVFLQRLSFPIRHLFKIWVAIYKPICSNCVEHIGCIITISKNVQNRVKQYYGFDSIVVYPAIDISKYRFEEYGNCWLSVNRLYPEKRVDLQINAFRQMPEEKLLIVGGFGKGDHAAKYAAKIINDLPDNVTLIGSIPEEELIELYATCKGLITTAMDEDFGITPIEAMASGKPTIAVRDGGYLETMIDGSTGLLIEPDEKAIINAVNLISQNPEKYRNDCKNRAKDFDLAPFIRQMSLIIESHMKKQQDIKA